MRLYNFVQLEGIRWSTHQTCPAGLKVEAGMCQGQILGLLCWWFRITRRKMVVVVAVAAEVATGHGGLEFSVTWD